MIGVQSFVHRCFRRQIRRSDAFFAQPRRVRPWESPSSVRNFSGIANDGEDSSASTGTEWRKKQLEKLESKFSNEPLVVDNEEDLQPMWKEMESRVIRRRPRTVEENGGRTGRVNVRRTDEEMWLKEGLYEPSSDKNSADPKR